ncbi:DUF4823 domain-containing protein [Fastidiosibacter lacustris]|uniref:DUF4823 domain-containing protein n=1 Tax=Fastidiosibacter lacustris TaxID=2056695 RepID=UPI001300395B|nr:DUF4823 domain-containing protein [Fastidiosibacter lacustris]
MQKTVAAPINDVHYVDKLVKLPKNATAYLAYPNNGYDDLHSYPQSGKKAINVINQSFKSYFRELHCAKDFRSAQFEYLAAREKNYDYFILPRITKWTDSYTLFTGIADEVVMNLKIYDLKTNTLINEIRINSQSSKVPGFEKSPSELLQEPLSAIASHLFIDEM